MNRFIKSLLSNLLFIIISLIILVSNSHSEIVVETIISGGYQDNLFSDSNSVGDEFTSIEARIKYYPSASTQISAGARYDAFASHGDLSNINGNLSVSIIPTPETSPISLALTGGLAYRKFGSIYKLYDQANVSYRLISWAHLQSSISYLNNSYSNSDFGSNRGFDFSTGVNLTILGSNTFAFRVDYSRHSFNQPTLIPETTNKSQFNNQDKSETFEITGVILRYSRPVGDRTGLKISAGYRRLHVNNDYTVIGYTIDYLSPWADLWEGISFSSGLKHFFPKQIITELSFAYFDKSFVDVIELGENTGETYWRDDRLTTLSLTISRPVSMQSGKLLTPSFYLGYRNNQSSIGFFDYDDILATISLNIVL
jgi:hypothetical protein